MPLNGKRREQARASKRAASLGAVHPQACLEYNPHAALALVVQALVLLFAQFGHANDDDWP
jgi:hypothetical protein